MTFIFKGNYAHAKPDPKYCAAAVHKGGRSVGFHQCNRKPVIHREIEGKKYGFCKQHDPVLVAAKDKARREKWDREWAEKQAKWDRQEQTAKALQACKKAIEQIAKGHNDPMTLAKETLKQFHLIGENYD